MITVATLKNQTELNVIIIETFVNQLIEWFLVTNNKKFIDLEIN